MLLEELLSKVLNKLNIKYFIISYGYNLQVYTDRFGLIGVYDAFGHSGAKKKDIKRLTNRLKNLFTKYNYLIYACKTLTITKDDVQINLSETELTMEDIERIEDINVYNLYLSTLHDMIKESELYCIYAGIKDNNNMIYCIKYSHDNLANEIHEDFGNLDTKQFILCRGWKDRDYRIVIYNCLDIDLDEEDYYRLRSDIKKLINIAAQFRHTYEFINYHFQLNLTKLKNISIKQMLIYDTIKKIKILKTINKTVDDRLSKFKIIYDCDIVREIRHNIGKLLEIQNLVKIDEDELITNLNSVINEILLDYAF